MMGCTSSSTYDPYAHSLPPRVDPSLPFTTYKQVFTVRNTWKAIQRKLEPTARVCLISFLNEHKQYKSMYPELEDVNTWPESKQEDNLALRNASLEFFNVLDEVIATLEHVDAPAVDRAMTIAYQEGLRLGMKDGVDQNYYKNMEEPLMSSFKFTLGDRFTENQETNMRLLYDFVSHYTTAGLMKSLNDEGKLDDESKATQLNNDKENHTESKKDIVKKSNNYANIPYIDATNNNDDRSTQQSHKRPP